MTKSEISILDATAGNRMIWKTKKHPRILWIDIEPELEVPADKIMDCRKTDFPDESINTIFFDPPHDYGYRHGKTWITAKNKIELEEFNKKYNMKRSLAYYGVEKYRSSSELLGFIHQAQKEFYRILKPDGML